MMKIFQNDESRTLKQVEIVLWGPKKHTQTTCSSFQIPLHQIIHFFIPLIQFFKTDFVKNTCSSGIKSADAYGQT